jgi:hypothetical protein
VLRRRNLGSTLHSLVAVGSNQTALIGAESQRCENATSFGRAGIVCFLIWHLYTLGRDRQWVGSSMAVDPRMEATPPPLLRAAANQRPAV